jgi:hypothetical protein
MPANFDFEREGNSGLLPNGVYRIVIEDAQEKTGPSGYPYVNLKIRAINKGQKSAMPIFEVLSTAPEARFRVEQFLDAVGAPESGSAGARWFKGKSCWASLKSDEYQGTWRNKVAQYLTEEAAQELIEKMANEANRASDDDDEDDTPKKKAPARSAAKRPAPKIDELEEEDIPF